MKITNIIAKIVPMDLKEPYSVAYETYDKAENVLIAIETNKGIVGYGCSAPDEPVTGDNPKLALKAIEKIAKPELKGTDPIRMVKIMETLKPHLINSPTALAAIDMALYDILGKTCNMPLWKLFGGYRDRIKTSITIGILPQKEVVKKARKYLRMGFKSIKLKGGLDVEADIANTIKLREIIGPKITLRFDANQGYSVEEALTYLEGVKHTHLEIFEQPTHKGEPDLLGNITSNTSTPVMADESLMTLRDTFRLVRRNLVDMVNIKLMKVGGISEALQINSVATSAKVPVMIGCMDEMALSISAGLHFALSNPNIIYADLDGHFDLINDPTEGALIFKNGTLFPTENPGLGLDIERKLFN